MTVSNLPGKLHNNQQFRRVYDQGQRFQSPFFSIFVLKTEKSGQKIGITVTRKIGCAVVRNRCKRRLREVVRNYYSRLPDGFLSGAGYELVINAKHSLVTAEFKQLEESFAQVMKRIHDERKRDFETNEK